VDFVRPGLAVDEEAVLAARAAWLYFAGGKTQAEIADLLSVPNSKAHRLIARASRDGLIRVFVEGPIAGCIALEEELKNRFSLSICEVVPNVDEGALPLRTLGIAGARFIRSLIENRKHPIIAFGHGRTLAAAVDYLPSVPAGGVKFVSLLGGLTRRFAASPFEVIHRLAERTGAEAYLMPVPFFANTVTDKQVLQSQYGVSQVIELGRSATLYIAGIGEIDRRSFIASGGMVDEADMAEVMTSGATGELLGQFFTAGGAHVHTTVSDRALAPRLEDLRTHKIVALAGGTSKVRAISAVLKSGLLSGLITDEATASRLLKENPEQESASESGKSAPG
jgi:DNA-binding transcriptional regulator LsrR (DeoR family)